MDTDEIHVGRLGIRHLVDGAQQGSMGIFELTVPPASNVPPPHSHSNNEEVVYVLEGTLRYSVGADTHDLAPGESMHTPKGAVHGFSNPFAGER
jgi:quercetin dioxygenase-like cupin family protein